MIGWIAHGGRSGRTGGTRGGEKPSQARSNEGVFETAMKTFNETVGLRMKGGGVNVGNVEESCEVVPERGKELRGWQAWRPKL